MPDTSPRLDLPLLLPSQAQKHVTHNEALMRLDLLVQLTVQALDAEIPPAAPAAGQAFGLGPAPVAGWAGQAGRLAVWDGVAWVFATPAEGWRAFDLTAGRAMVFSAGAWAPVAPDPQNLDGVGIGTTSDPVNRLAVAGDATLLSHGGSDHRLKINKATAGDTASLLFQSGWTGHAEMGLAGDSAFSIKVSADGQAWSEALRADPGAQTLSWAPAGTVRMALSDSGLHLDVPVTGTAVQASPADSAAGRLLKVGAFGLGDRTISAQDFSAAPEITGFFHADSAGVNKPAFASNFAMLQMARSSTLAAQMAVGLNYGINQNARFAIRAKTGATTWGPWFELYSQTSILGTVSQSGGVVTGALIEKGNNANGYYRRYACGKLECWHIKAAGSGGAATWTFPSAFIEAPVVAATAVASVNASAQLDAAPGTTAATYSVRDKTDARRADTVHLHAIGRWSALT